MQANGDGVMCRRRSQGTADDVNSFFFLFFLFAPQAGNGLSGLTGGMKLIRRFSLPPTPPNPHLFLLLLRVVP